MAGVQLNYDKFNKVGLKPLIKKFQRHGAEIIEIEGNNKAKREAGFLVKTATIYFDDGQKVVVKAKPGGDIAKVQLNNKVVPMRHMDDLDKAILEIADFVLSNSKAFKKQRARAVTAKAKRDAKPSVKQTFDAKLKDMEGQAADLQEEAGALEARISEYERERNQKASILSDLEKEFKVETDTTNELENELAELQKEAA